MAKFRVTYDIVTPESAELGDSADRGFCLPGGWEFSTEEDSTLPACEEGEFDLSLRDALSACGLRRGGGFEDSGDWFTTIDPRLNYSTGAETRYSVHPPDGITSASYGRLRRYLTGRQ